MGVSKNRGIPKWMVYHGKPYQNGWFGAKTHHFRKHLHVNLGRSFNLIKTHLYLEPNDRPLFFRGWPEPFYGEKNFQNMGPRLGSRHQYPGWKCPAKGQAALFRWFWPLKKQWLLTGEIRTTVHCSLEMVVWKTKKQTYRFRLLFFEFIMYSW